MSGLVWPVAASARDCFLLKHWRAEGAGSGSWGSGHLTVSGFSDRWKVSRLRSANVWGGGNEKIERDSWSKRERRKIPLSATIPTPLPKKKKKEERSSHLPLLPSISASTHSVIRAASWDRRPLRAFITWLKLCYCCGWHSKRTTRARQFILQPFHLEEFLHVCVCEKAAGGCKVQITVRCLTVKDWKKFIAVVDMWQSSCCKLSLEGCFQTSFLKMFFFPSFPRDFFTFLEPQTWKRRHELKKKMNCGHNVNIPCTWEQHLYPWNISSTEY